MSPRLPSPRCRNCGEPITSAGRSRWVHYTTGRHNCTGRSRRVARPPIDHRPRRTDA